MATIVTKERSEVTLKIWRPKSIDIQRSDEKLKVIISDIDYSDESIISIEMGHDERGSFIALIIRTETPNQIGKVI
jgi:hypothetical protein